MNQQDLNQIQARGISEQQIEHQLEQIKQGFPFLKLEGAAAIGKGIVAPTDDEVTNYEKAWNDYKAEGHKIVKFVPASTSRSSLSVLHSATNVMRMRARASCVSSRRATTRLW